MEYEVHTLKEIQDPVELQGPGDPPWEGVHVFRNARKRLHEEYREGKRGVLYLTGWYLYHLMTFWTLPNRLVEWEVRKIKRMTRKTLPKAMAEWSEPLPEDQWTKPSKELKRQSKRVLELQKADPQRPVAEIFAQEGVFRQSCDDCMTDTKIDFEHGLQAVMIEPCLQARRNAHGR